MMAVNIPPAHPLLLLSIVAGLAYPFFWDSGLSDIVLLAAKGSGVTLLALYAATQARSRDGWLLTAVMAFGALGDVLLNIRFEAGVLAFATGHLIAIWLYVRNRPYPVTAIQKWMLGLLPLASFAMPWVILGPRDDLVGPGVHVGLGVYVGLGAYALLLTLMTVTAWISRFPTRLVGVGAALFLISDGLIVARMGPFADVVGISLAVWLLYYFGQLLICVGVSQTLARQ